MNFRRWFVVGMALVGASVGFAGRAPGELACRAVVRGQRVELCSPFFIFRLSTAAGLRAVSWENRLTGRSLSLGAGKELDFEIGLPGGETSSPRLDVTGIEVRLQGEAAEVCFRLAAGHSASATAVYRWDDKQPVLRKLVEITNAGPGTWNRLLDVRLGDYRTAARPSGAGGQGFPLYLEDEFFLSLAHPAGWSVAEAGRIQLRQHPGEKVRPHDRFHCMEAVLGVAKRGQARSDFVDHVRGRMRRAARGHDRPYAIFEPFGARPGGDFNETEEFLLDNIARLSQGQRQSGCHFDFYSIDFWVDFHGDIKRCDPQRFPRGLSKITQELEKLGTAPGLWIDSGGLPAWTVGGNPAVAGCFSEAHGKGGLCRATEPIKSMYVEAFRHHIRHNGVRLLKFDNLLTTCNNPQHQHLPGVYSTEAIHNSLIEFLQALDAECPDVFLMLYWGYRSPWWLLYADTYFDSGVGIEAASPADLPAPFVRDSVTQKLDQAQWRANEDVPPLGKDSLGVWLSDWSWNSQVGAERWQEGFVMDLCRGSLLAQPWSDTPWLSPPERKQMADFIGLLKARPECFGRPRFVLGNPWKDEPYGYCCVGGQRAVLALYNCSWKDSVLPLELNPAWGLPDGRAWDLYRWYPDPARLRGPDTAFGRRACLALRPFEVVMLEVVPHGERPALNRAFEDRPIPTGFAEASRTVELATEETTPRPALESAAPWTVLKPAGAVSAGGARLERQPDGSLLASGENASPDTYTITAHTDLAGITAFRLEALADPSLPGGGPGRAVNGNFALDELRITAAPRANPAAAVPVALRNPSADFFQEGYGGWPVAAAIDGDPRTGWSIDPAEGLPHVAVFPAREPLGFAGGTTLTFSLVQGSPPQHNLGRLRLSATAANPPPGPPKAAGPKSLAVRGQVPASPGGGTLVVTVQIRRGGALWPVGGPGRFLSAEAKLAGRAVPCRPVVGTATYPCSWQAWRLSIEPSARPQALELGVSAALSGNVTLSCQGHLIPGK
jgi:hypothetical protein